MVSAPVLMLTTGPIIVIVSPLPFEMEMPESLTTIIAPVVLLRRIPPVTGVGGMSLIMNVCCSRDWMTMLGSAGLPALASVGMSDGKPQRQPTQTGLLTSPCSNWTQTPAPIGGTMYT